ncbi:MAG: DEAD/DEAH box helicase family protein [Flavobacteriaceae bacterium]|nr:DEAD/DEAH box helicase family protein [Flavobacteriaceae bacterium]
MNDILLADKITNVFEADPGVKKGVPVYIRENLNGKFKLRPYQIEAFERFDCYMNRFPNKDKPVHLLYHMATGSGKTIIMAGLILDLYKKGYRNFIFFVHLNSIIKKTKDNFLNPASSKYLFADTIAIEGQNIQIKEVDNFEAANDENIHIVFTTIQGLHTKLNTPRENSLTVEDFEDKKIVLISDEAHHINAETKKRKTKKEEIHSKSWEKTVNEIFNSNPQNYLLEFTATIDSKNSEINKKYKEKIIFDYPLIKFRTDRYSKEIQILKSNTEPFDRVLMAVISSQYRKKVFAHNGLEIKPVILFKSYKIDESEYFHEKFIAEMKKLTASKLKRIKDMAAGSELDVVEKAFNYFDKKGITLENLVIELKDDFLEDKCISVNSENDSEQKQIIINTLENQSNPYRAVFAVNQLNEGWDVLNLFDIVRMYDKQGTGGSNKGKISKSTMSEAQLIGRGARYCPFLISEQYDKEYAYKRKYDDDIENELRICEELYYHSKNNSQYISELRKALSETGAIDIKRTTRKLKLKPKFKKTYFYKNGRIYLNKREEHNRKEIDEIDASIREEVYKKSLYTPDVAQEILIKDEKTKKTDAPKNDKIKIKKKQISEIYKLGAIDQIITRKAINQLYKFYRFDNLQKFFPNLKSISQFIEDPRYLKDITIELWGNEEQVKNPSNEELLSVVKSTLDDISLLIDKNFKPFKGTKEFLAKDIPAVFEDKTISTENKAQSDEDDEKHVDIDEEDWYAFNENYGTDQEKFLVKYISRQKSKIKEQYDDFYLIRNERHFGIYSFDGGNRFEPDFVLFLIPKNPHSLSENNKTLSQNNNNNSLNENKKIQTYQLFIEPKGEHLISSYNSRWKNEFLKQIENEHEIKSIFEDERYRLLGLPLFNEKENYRDFDKKFDDILGNYMLL